MYIFFVLREKINNDNRFLQSSLVEKTSRISARARLFICAHISLARASHMFWLVSLFSLRESHPPHLSTIAVDTSEKRV